MTTEYLPLPIAGKLINLAEVPDEVFSKKVLGNGFAVQFTGTELRAPFEGTIIATFPTGHSVILRRKDGLEILMHVGLSSAKMPEAFNCKVKKYQNVVRGQLLIDVKPECFNETNNFCPVVFSTPDIQINISPENQDAEVLDSRVIQVTF